MPRPLTPTDPQGTHPPVPLSIGFRYLDNVAICILHAVFTGLNMPQGVRSPLWPTWFPVYASHTLFDKNSSSHGGLRLATAQKSFKHLEDAHMIQKLSLPQHTQHSVWVVG